jgi:histidinol dehydrogenase
VRTGGDQAIKAYALQFDKVSLEQLYLNKADLEAIAASIPEEAKTAIDVAYANIRKFHAAQIQKPCQA